MSSITRGTWQTRNEINFIKNIGTGQYSQSVSIKLKTREEMLQHYINAAKNRRIWDGVDSQVVIGFAETILTGLLFAQKTKKP